MLNKYLDLLQHATEAMTSVGKTGAGAAEYFQAVGYEFLFICLSVLNNFSENLYNLYVIGLYGI